MGILAKSDILFIPDEAIMFWEPAGAMALSIFLTIALFMAAYASAYLIVSGFFKTGRAIKKIVQDKKED